MRQQDQYALIDLFRRRLEVQSNKLKWLCIILVVIYTAVFIGGLFIPAKDSTEAMAKYGVMGFLSALGG